MQRGERSRKASGWVAGKAGLLMLIMTLRAATVVESLNPRRGLRVGIIMPNGCTPKIRATEELHDQCILLLRERDYSQSRGTIARLSNTGCSAFPAFQGSQVTRLSYKAAYIAAFRRIAPLLHERGWSVLVLAADEVKSNLDQLTSLDLIVSDASMYGKIRKVTTSTKYVVLASHDSASLSTTALFKDDQMVAFLQHTDFKDPEEHNKELLKTRRHTMWLREGGIEIEGSLTTKSLPPSSLSKLVTMIPQIQRWRYPLDCGGGRATFARFARAGFGDVHDHKFALEIARRRVDIAFAGHVGGKGREKMGINAHRRKAIEAIRELGHKHRLKVEIYDTDIPYQQYIYLLRTSKVFVSPFGIGEFSGKDYEALMAGALLVKPSADRLKAYPNIYDSNYTVSVAVDFSDLGEKLLPYLKGSEGHVRAQVMSDSARELLNVYGSKEQFAKDVDRLLLSLLRPAATDALLPTE